MGIFDIFKKEKVKKPKEIKKIKKPPKVKVEKKPKLPKKIKPEISRPKSKAKISKIVYQVFKSPHVTEKATDLVNNRQYIFKVWSKANKIEIKKAIESLYGVDVMSVKIIKISKKRRRLGKITGWRKGYKKAIIKIKEGQKIEVLPR